MAEYRPDGIYYPAAPGESPNGVAPPPGVTLDAGSRDPSATSVAGAIANAYANMAEMETDSVSPAGSPVGDRIELPDKGY